MKFQAQIDIMPHSELLDPQGKTVANNMDNVGISGVEDIRIGKHIVMTFDAESEAEATEKTEMACRKLLANVIIETYTFKINLIEEKPVEE